MAPYCISPPLFFCFCLLFEVFFFACENVASQMLCSKWDKNSRGKQGNNDFRMLGGTVVNTATSQQVACGFTSDSRPFCLEFSVLSTLFVAGMNWWFGKTVAQNSWDTLCSTQMAWKEFIWLRTTRNKWNISKSWRFRNTFAGLVFPMCTLEEFLDRISCSCRNAAHLGKTFSIMHQGRLAATITNCCISCSCAGCWR